MKRLGILLVPYVLLLPLTGLASATEATNSVPSGTEAAASALIDIKLSLKNIAINASRPSESAGHGFAMEVSELSFSDTEHGILDQAFTHQGIRKAVEKWKNEAITGRTVFARYEIRNMPLEKAMLTTNRFYPLFQISWYKHRLDYSFLTTNGLWKTGTSLPSSQFYDTPSKATIYGVGEAGVLIPGDKVDLKPDYKVRDIDAVEKGLDYKVVTTKHWLHRPVALDVADLRKPSAQLPKLANLEGRATLGDSLIETKRSPFCYPFDRYEISFYFFSRYSAEVTAELHDVEDLDVESDRRLTFRVKPGAPEMAAFSLARQAPVRKFLLRDAAAFVGLFFLSGGLLKRLIAYFVPVAALYAALPVPKNVPVLCVQNLVVLGLLVAAVVYGEWRMFRQRQKPSAAHAMQAEEPTAAQSAIESSDENKSA